MPSYVNKPKTPKVVAPQPEEEGIVTIHEVASKGRDALLDAMREHTMKTEAALAEKPVQAPSERQRTRTEMEMERGRTVSERHAANAAAQRMPTPEPSDGYTVPAFRPGDYVPNFDQGTKLGDKTLK